MTPDAELPVWEREDAFALAKPGWGWMDRAGNCVEVAGFEELAQAVEKDAGARVNLVWTPAAKGFVLPEEVPELFPAMREARIRWARWDIQEGRRQMMVFGGALGVLVLFQLYRHQFDPDSVLKNGPLGFALLLFVILGFLPWYQGRKRLARARSWGVGEMAEDGRAFRFEIWLAVQKTPVTRLLLGLLAMVGLVQLFAEVRNFNAIHRLEGLNALLGVKEFIFSGFSSEASGTIA